MDGLENYIQASCVLRIEKFEPQNKCRPKFKLVDEGACRGQIRSFAAVATSKPPKLVDQVELSMNHLRTRPTLLQSK
jgi:hypothetical protein